jgi:bifunctional DNA-binding transcriptional regulator/antitoxin component of YhaV-PrlF toxin-antitoxin module
MQELFRMKIAGKRQLTLPQRLLDVLGLAEGDEIQIEVSDGQIVGTHACKTIPTTLLGKELLSKIRKREERLVQGKGLTVAEAIARADETPVPQYAIALAGHGRKTTNTEGQQRARAAAAGAASYKKTSGRA